MKIIFLLVFVIISNSSIYADPALTVRVQRNAYAPYVILDPQTEAKGILIEVLRKSATEQNIQLLTKKFPKKRVIKGLLHGQIDAAPMAKEWFSEKGPFLFSDPIVKIQDVLVSLRSSPIEYSTPEKLKGLRIITHLGFKYPLLDPYFKNRKIRRRDGKNEFIMLKMLKLKRGEAAVLNHLVALWLIKNNPDFQNLYSISKNEISNVAYRIIFHEKWAPFVKKFNQDLKRMKQNGDLKKIISKYR